MTKKVTRLFIGCMALGTLTPVWSLTISPSRTQVVLSPGMQKKMAFTVFNEEAQPVQVDVSEKDWFVLPANKAIKTDSWLKLHGSKQFILKSHQTRKVKATVEVPVGAVGELVGMTSFMYRGETPSMVLPMISVSVYLAVAGTQVSSGTISDLYVAALPDRLRVLATVENTGNIHLRPSGSLTIFDPQGQVVKELSVPDGGAPTYPGNTRPYVGEAMAFHLKPGDYKVSADISSDGLALKAERAFTVALDGKVEMSDKK